jgi:serine/threonine-protein kinase HipA
VKPPLIRQTTPGKLPPFILSLLPEGWLEAVLKDRDERATLRSGKRYMSNITIVEQRDELAALPSDVLLTRLDRYARSEVFTGSYAGPGRGDLEDSFERNLARIYERADTPRLSGVQIKAPMYLDAKGTLSPGTGKPFAHILKPAGTSGFESLPIVEWLALALGRAAGFVVPQTALVTVPFQPGKDAGGYSVIERRHPHGAKPFISGLRYLQQRHVLEVHVAVRDQPGKERPPEEDDEILLRRGR